jgi:LPXTG-motif cell wall-anchored protein
VVEDGAVTEGRFANIIPYIVAGIVLVLVILGLLFSRRR